MADINVTTAKRSTSPVEVAYAYAGIGTGGMVVNIFILCVLLSDRKFLKQSANIAGIAISHLLCAFSIGAAGYYRAVNYTILTRKATAWSCVSRIYPAMFPVAFQSTGVMLAVVGVERFSVFMFPHWYRSKWTTTRSWQVVGVGYVCVGISFLVGIYGVWQAPSTTLNCPYTSTFGNGYILFSSFVSACGGTTAVGFTLFGWIKGTLRVRTLPLLSGEAGRYKRQLRLTRSMLSVALCDFCLVVIPNVFFILSILNPNIFSASVSGNLSNFTNITYCINTVMSLGTYMAFHRQFRAVATDLVRRKKTTSVHVTPVGKELNVLEMRAP